MVDAVSLGSERNEWSSEVTLICTSAGCITVSLALRVVAQLRSG